MTPQELYSALDAYRKARGWPWWQIEAAIDIDQCIRRRMRDGAVSWAVRTRAEALLGGRRQALTRKE